MSMIKINFRIPGQWSHPKDLVDRLPGGFRLTPESLFLPDGEEIEFGAARPDNQFAQIFRSSCRNPPTEEELAAVDNYTVNAFLSGPGGSLDSARTMMRAAAAVIRGGGAGVFIDNCGLAHGGQNWLDMTEDGSSDAVSFAFVAIVQGRQEVYTMGMHVLGLRDVVMKKADADDEEFGIVEVIRYLASGEKPVDDGHVLADLSGPRYQAFAEEGPKELAGSIMGNPFGRLQLVSMKDVSERN